MPRRSDARTNAITTAARLFDRQGYHGTALTQILEESGAPKGSFYFHFPQGKQQLAVEAVAAARGQVEILISNAIVRHPNDAANAIEALARSLARWMRETDFREGCSVAAMTIEAATISPEVQLACRDAYASWRGALADLLRASGLNTTTSRGLASLVVGSLEGAVIMGRAERSTDPVRDAGAQLAILLTTTLATVRPNRRPRPRAVRARG